MGGFLDEDPDATMVASVGELQEELRKRGKSKDRASIVVLAGTNVGEMYRVEGVEVVIGRATNATVRLNDDGISRRHARIYLHEGHHYVEDLGSANGTMINGVKVARQRLEDGDKIRLGPTTILKFGYHDDIEESFQQRMFDAALRDGLTGEFNKKFLLDRLESELAYARRHNVDLSLLLFDVDFFKRINDTYGHLAGDEMLRVAARLLLSHARQEDIVCRFGGEEFAIVLPKMPAEIAEQRAEMWRREFEEERVVFGRFILQATISIGVAAFPGNGRTRDELIDAADHAHYEAKAKGRNRIQMADGIAAPAAL